MTVKLGADAADGQITIVHGCRFRLDLELYDDDGPVNWPAGVKVLFETGATWPATVVDDKASWNVPAATAAGVAAGTKWWINQENTGGNDPDPLYVGKVSAK